ncbi:hypothetical protein ABEB36_006723 [Hypothenemus hampei]|uniref:C2H2-type domain-containing protein n=1 Tax=Hypothenemus hampei TaxID=57062 RepID=A0ABD1ERJ2_HYPHA
MLTSNASNQYLRPEYLTPLPTTLDAKKSPLALLAQTCSQIGADTPNSKLLQSADKTSKPSKDKSTSSFSNTSTPSEPKSNPPKSPREKSRSPEERITSRTPSSNASIRNGRLSNQSATSRESPIISERKSPEKSPEKTSSDGTSSTSPVSAVKTSTTTAFTPNILTSSSDPAIKDLPLGTFKPGVPPVSSAFLSYPGGLPPMPPSLLSPLSPYFSYGRLKSQQDICRDPYCTGCSSVSGHLMAQKCPAGCTQCDHKTTSGYSVAAYAHAQLAALAAAAQLPYICNWISGDAAYCGKRFGSSEELLTHLRTHTSGSSEGFLPPPLLHRGSTTYPTPPLSPRYHPYNKPGGSFVPPPLGWQHPAAMLPPYFSPATYSIYGGPRLGSSIGTPGMHP